VALGIAKRPHGAESSLVPLLGRIIVAVGVSVMQLGIYDLARKIAHPRFLRSCLDILVSDATKVRRFFNFRFARSSTSLASLTSSHLWQCGDHEGGSPLWFSDAMSIIALSILTTVA
jgi:hypothetical protein